MEQKSTLEGLTCQQIFALLSEYLDAELPADLCEKLAHHIGDCAPCVEFVDSLRRSIDLCREFEPGTMPEPLAEEARERLRKAYEGVSDQRY